MLEFVTVIIHESVGNIYIYIFDYLFFYPLNFLLLFSGHIELSCNFERNIKYPYSHRLL